jgi:AraC-like DNA-binding protein/ligand-binding sensor protein
MLDHIEQLTRQGAVYHGLYESRLILNRDVRAFCRHALAHPMALQLCRAACINATLQAMTSGEPYFCRCWANLLMVTVPLAPQNKCCGGIALGGFFVQGDQGEIREAITRAASTWPGAETAGFLERLPSLRSITPSALRGLGALVMENTLSSGLNSSEFFRTQNEKYLQQRRIAEAFADIRRQPVSPPDLLGDTYQLVTFLNQNDKAGAMAFISTYLAKLLMASNWDQVKLKAHVRVLLAVMTSQDILRGTPWAVATSREMRRMIRLEQAQSTEESCYEVADWIQERFRGQDAPARDGRSLAERTTTWLQAHFQERVTLATASRAVGASASTLVHRLRRETGKRFKQLLLEIRLAEAKKLLATTALNLSAIGDACGFFDQSHFTREFKRAINLTPGQFRKLLSVPDEALRQPTPRLPDETAAPRTRRRRKTDRPRR